MARYKHIDTSPCFIPVDLQRQLLPSTIEHALNHQIELGSLNANYKNDTKGASAYLPLLRCRTTSSQSSDALPPLKSVCWIACRATIMS